VISPDALLPEMPAQRAYRTQTEPMQSSTVAEMYGLMTLSSTVEVAGQ